MPTAGLYGMGAGAILGGLQYGQQQHQYDTNMQLAWEWSSWNKDKVGLVRELS